jgi:hypothetical protein
MEDNTIKRKERGFFFSIKFLKGKHQKKNRFKGLKEVLDGLKEKNPRFKRFLRV